MSNTLNVISAVKTLIKSGVASLKIDNFPVSVAEGLYPDAIVTELSSLGYPAVMLRAYDSDFPTISNAGQVYIEELPLGIMIYVDNNGATGTQEKLLKIEDAIIDELSTNADLKIHEGYVLVNSINRGSRVEGTPDLYRVGFYDSLSISEIMITINYRRC